ncbi:hypothetical protein [Streptomyces sp. NPDC006996]
MLDLAFHGEFGATRLALRPDKRGYWSGCQHPAAILVSLEHFNDDVNR